MAAEDPTPAERYAAARTLRGLPRLRAFRDGLAIDLDMHHRFGARAFAGFEGDADEEAIREYCREQMAGFKVPDVVYIADSLPRTATGKIQRRHMVAAFAEDK